MMKYRFQILEKNKFVTVRQITILKPAIPSRRFLVKIHKLAAKHPVVNGALIKIVWLPVIALTLCFLSSIWSNVQAQQYDLLIKNGQVIDPGSHINASMDIGIEGGKIAKIAKNIPASQSKKVINATGFLVSPGLIDIHTHVFVGSNPNTFADGFLSVSPDDFTFRSGVTTVVDAGTSGWQNFSLFKSQVVDQSRTRVLAFLNIFGPGMAGGPGVGFPGIKDIMANINSQMAYDTVKKYTTDIVGICLGHYDGNDWSPFDSALLAARLSNVPVFVECHLPGLSLEELLDRMRPGDILTHAFEDILLKSASVNLNDKRTSVVDSKGVLRPFVLKAQKKGILFDVGHGGAGFWFSQAIPAMKQGLLPNSFGTDLHRFSMNAGMKDILNIMSKYLTMGMTVEDIISRATWLPAKAIKRDDLGNLNVGSVADISILSIQHGTFGFVDAGGYKIQGTRKFQAELTIRAGKIVWDLNGIAAQKYEKPD
jgi:dihydroorotase